MKPRVVAGDKITNPDVYKLPLAGMRACLVAIERAFDQDGGVSRASYDVLGCVYDELLALTDHVVNGYPLVRSR